jgi:hypothetical protein
MTLQNQGDTTVDAVTLRDFEQDSRGRTAWTCELVLSAPSGSRRAVEDHRPSGTADLSVPDSAVT